MVIEYEKVHSALLELLQAWGIRSGNLTAKSPYYNPHVQRRTLFPSADGYQPPKDALDSVARRMNATAQLKAQFPPLGIVGTSYEDLRKWLGTVGQYKAAEP